MFLNYGDNDKKMMQLYALLTSRCFVECKMKSSARRYIFPRFIRYYFFLYWSFMVVWGFGVGVLYWVFEVGVFS